MARVFARVRGCGDVPGLEAEKVDGQVKAELHNKKGCCWLAKSGIRSKFSQLACCCDRDGEDGELQEKLCCHRQQR